MTEFFITARSFAAPFVSDTSERYVEADTPRQALEMFAETYGHPAGLFAAECWSNTDHFHKRGEPLARWQSNHLIARTAAADGENYSYLGHGPGSFELNGEEYLVDNPTAGRVTS